MTARMARAQGVPIANKQARVRDEVVAVFGLGVGTGIGATLLNLRDVKHGAPSR